MFKKVKSADTQKQKQLSLFDFLNPPKRKINQPIPSINKKTNLTNQNKKVCIENNFKSCNLYHLF